MNTIKLTKITADAWANYDLFEKQYDERMEQIVELLKNNQALEVESNGMIHIFGPSFTGYDKRVSYFDKNGVALGHEELTFNTPQFDWFLDNYKDEFEIIDMIH